MYFSSGFFCIISFVCCCCSFNWDFNAFHLTITTHFTTKIKTHFIFTHVCLLVHKWICCSIELSQFKCVSGRDAILTLVSAMRLSTFFFNEAGNYRKMQFVFFCCCRYSANKYFHIFQLINQIIVYFNWSKTYLIRRIG